MRRLAERLKQAGLRVWFDEWIIRPGDDIIALKVDEGWRQSRVLVLCLSPAALGSEWVALERSTASIRDPSNAGRRFIPLLLADCELPDTLRRYKYVDFREETEAAFAELLAACRPESGSCRPLPSLRRRSKPRRKSPANKPPEQTEPLAVLERKLTGHEGWVNSVAVSPDGKWAASGSDDKTVKIWDLETGECRATLEGHTSDSEFRRDHAGWEADSVGIERRHPFAFGTQARAGNWRSWHGHTNVSLVGGRFAGQRSRAFRRMRQYAQALGSRFGARASKTIECGTDDADDVFGIAVDPAGTQALSGHRDGRFGSGISKRANAWRR